MSVLWVLCVFGYRSLRRANHSFREVLPSVVCLSVIANPRYRGGLGPLGGCCDKEEKLCCSLLGLCYWRMLTLYCTSHQAVLYVCCTLTSNILLCLSVDSSLSSLLGLCYWRMLTLYCTSHQAVLYVCCTLTSNILLCLSVDSSLSSFFCLVSKCM